MPRSAAAFFWVSFRSVMSWKMRPASCALRSASSGLGKPRSAKTLPLLGSTSGVFAFVFLFATPVLIVFFRVPQSLHDEVDFLLGGLDTLRGLLLEGMEHV